VLFGFVGLGLGASTVLNLLDVQGPRPWVFGASVIAGVASFVSASTSSTSTSNRE
jgi:hypothetical protein